MRSFRRGRNLIGLSCLLALAACATTPPTPTTSDAAAATVDRGESDTPAVSSIAFRGSPARGDTYGLGETVEVNVRFDRAVAATGKPQVALTIGTQTRHATLSSWSRQSLYFAYTVQEEDRDEDGIGIAANSLLLNGGTIKSADGAIDADLTHEAVAAKPSDKVNGSLSTKPEVSDIALVSSPAPGDTYGLGETVEVRVDFDRAVAAAGKPQVALTIGTRTRHATLSSWSRQSLYFAYTVQAEDRDEDGISIAANSLLLNGGTIRAAVGTPDVDLSHDAVAADGDKVNGSDREAPKVMDISFRSAPARGETYELGEIIEVSFEFDKAVTATGKPQVALTIGTHTRYATFFAWGRQVLYFTYAVQEDDRDEDGISIVANALALDGGTIKSADGTIDADLTHRAVAAERRRKVNGSDSSPPSVRDIAFNSSPARADTFGLGETVEVRVEFDRAVKATGSPRVALNIGKQIRHATLSAWSPQSMHFEYTVQGPDRDEDGISIPANALLLNGGTIKSADGTTDADLTHGPVADKWRSKVNGGSSMPPGVREISFISSPAKADTYELGETIEVLVEFDRAVTVTGIPHLALIIGTRTRLATYSVSWRDARYVQFSYAVRSEDRDPDGVSIAANALSLGRGTITNAGAATTGADITHGAVAADRDHRVDGSLVTAPVVRALYLDNHVPPPTGDTYVRGERVRVWVEFDRDVTVTGRPLVALTIGSQTRQAIYSGHSIAAQDGRTIIDEDVLSFDYLVQATDLDEDGISIAANALALDGGAIRHAANFTVDADLGHGAVPADPARKVNGSRAES